MMLVLHLQCLRAQHTLIFFYIPSFVFVISWLTSPPKKLPSPRQSQKNWEHVALGWCSLQLCLRSCLIWWWWSRHGRARPMWFQSTCCCTSSLPHRWRICLSASCWKLHCSGCSPAAAWSPPGHVLRGVPGSAAGCCAGPCLGSWWWSVVMIPGRNSLAITSATTIHATAARGCRPGCRHRSRPGGTAAAPHALQIPKFTAAVVHTQLLQRAGGTLCSACSSALAAVSISISCCGRPSSGSCGWDSPGPGHLLLQAAGRGARHPGSGHNEHRDRGSGLGEKSVLHTYDCWAILPRCHPWYEWDFAIFADGQFHVFCRIRHHFLHIFTSASGPGWSSEALECDIGNGEAWPVHWRFAENHALREGTGSATTAVSSILRISVRYIQSCSSLVIYIFIVFELKISGGGHLLVSRAQAPRCACDAIWSIVVSPKRWKKTSGRTSRVLSLGSHFHGRWNVLFKHVWL